LEGVAEGVNANLLRSPKSVSFLGQRAFKGTFEDITGCR
jgi:hypothetical protein